ncbi:MAG: HEAT repeat domain-containing protein [Deltaproteobacteria bacterium]|nr:HEAT repeat domain-containing protein [Deltaproteobacteria bacterium]
MTADEAAAPGLWDEPLRAVLAAAILGLLGFALLDLAWLVSRAFAAHLAERRFAAFWRTHGQSLVAALGDPAAEARWVAHARHASRAVLQKTLDAYLTRTSGEFRERLGGLYEALGLAAEDLAALRSRRRSARLRALRRIATVARPEHRAAILAASGEGGEARLIVAQIIGRIGTAEDVLGLLATWRVTSRLGEYPIHVMLEAMPATRLRELLPRWSTIPCVHVRRIALGAAARTTPASCAGLLEAAARDPSIEVRIAACHAAHRITTPETAALLGRLARDEAWEVRAQAVKALANHVTPDATELLVAALIDKSFWVRQNAASALGAHGGAGVLRLQALARETTDRFARDAAEHVLSDLAMKDLAGREAAA